jgi:hypothetical protein
MAKDCRFNTVLGPLDGYKIRADRSVPRSQKSEANYFNLKR